MSYTEEVYERESLLRILENLNSIRQSKKFWNL